ncbi:hypothetical protein MHLP_01720 [Candidatus Mycoplasma haematolamae str. Purdue]|uniref:Uncharacterized protein n=1 Tax=Mycoplasma haematolamae (strain Purdue) TaxID=1212765 RepID=I7CJ83_MYCHA|nr:hypothetical protein [Candidatus Mycoplasma haematolamae]AFO51924.1 hypothetical protein MHLP_01720 [Candidatus Mycoplasma haematolamae str. Purdue]
MASSKVIISALLGAGGVSGAVVTPLVLSRSSVEQSDRSAGESAQAGHTGAPSVSHGPENPANPEYSFAFFSEDKAIGVPLFCANKNNAYPEFRVTSSTTANIECREGAKTAEHNTLTVKDNEYQNEPISKLKCTYQDSKDGRYSCTYEGGGLKVFLDNVEQKDAAAQHVSVWVHNN